MPFLQAPQKEIEYKFKGGLTHTYNWTGNLAFLETQEVELPSFTNWNGTANIFEVTLKLPNGQVDDYTAYNSMQTEFEYVPEYPADFAVWMNTNAGVTSTGVSETSWDFYDANGTSVFTSGNVYANTQYRDTLSFTPGCYSFVVSDTDKDGLHFWANNDGAGLLRFREIGASWINIFNADFGTNIIHQFTVGYGQNIMGLNNSNLWMIYPNPTNNFITIEGLFNGKTKIEIFDNLGKIIKNFSVISNGFAVETIDLSEIKNGIYFIQISNSEGNTIKKIVKQ